MMSTVAAQCRRSRGQNDDQSELSSALRHIVSKSVATWWMSNPTIIWFFYVNLFWHRLFLQFLSSHCPEDLNSLPLGQLEETTRTPSYYVDEDYPARPEIQQPVPE